MLITTRFSPWQPVVYEGKEYIVYSIYLRAFRAKLVERYQLYDGLGQLNVPEEYRAQVDVDVSHLSPVEAPEPDRDELELCRKAQGG